MENTKKRQPVSSVMIATIVVGIIICVLFVSCFMALVTKIMEYNEIQKQKEQLNNEIKNRQEEIEEKEYWLMAPMDDEYIMKFAKEKLDLFRADEIVFTNDNQK